jgi:hypothetical protein
VAVILKCMFQLKVKVVNSRGVCEFSSVHGGRIIKGMFIVLHMKNFELRHKPVLVDRDRNRRQGCCSGSRSTAQCGTQGK